MKQGIPKSMQDLLARQTAADEHPSADLLNGYMEQSLTASERTQVTKHLAACGECREIVFLASSVQEEEAVPAVAAAMPAQERQVVAPGGRRKSSWVWWKWAVPAVAVIAVAAGVVLHRDRIPQRAHPKRDTLALNTSAIRRGDQSRERGNPEPPAEPAARASQAAPTESKKRVAAEDGKPERGRRPGELNSNRHRKGLWKWPNCPRPRRSRGPAQQQELLQACRPHPAQIRHYRWFQATSPVRLQIQVARSCPTPRSP